MKKIAIIPGSTRKDSFNKKLGHTAMLKKYDNIEFIFIDLKDYPIPIYDGDLEKEGIPENVTKLREMITNADGLIFVSPEYNAGISAVLKNAFDWVSRSIEGKKRLDAFSNKPIGLMSASPSPYGGSRGLKNFRNILETIKLEVLEYEVSISGAREAFDDTGLLKDKENIEKVETLVQKIVDKVSK